VTESLSMIILMSISLWKVLGFMTYSVAKEFADKNADKSKFIWGLGIKQLLVDIITCTILQEYYGNNTVFLFCKFVVIMCGIAANVALLRLVLGVIYEKLFFVLCLADLWKYVCCHLAGAVIWGIAGNKGDINAFYGNTLLDWSRIALVIVFMLATYYPINKVAKKLAAYKMKMPRLGGTLALFYLLAAMITATFPSYLFGRIIIPEIMVGVITITVMANYAFNFEIGKMSKLVNAMEYEKSLMKDYCDTLDDQINMTKGIRHDLKNNLQVLSALCEEGNLDEVRRYVQEWSDMSDAISVKKYSDIQVINATMALKEKKCRELGIKLDVDIDNIELGEILEIELTTIMFNLIDNAIDGCRMVEEDKSFISIKCKNVYNQLIIIVKNSCNTAQPYTHKDDVNEHGYGLKIVKSIVNKYTGSINIQNEDNVFKVDINLNAKINS